MGTKKCPYCAEEIQAEAIKCRFCSTSLDSKNLKKIKQIRPKNHVPGWLIFLAILGTIIWVVNSGSNERTKQPTRPIPNKTTSRIPNKTTSRITNKVSKEFYLRIAFCNETKSQPLSTNCRMWIRGFGDFYPVRQHGWKFGGTLLEKAGPFDVKGENVIYFYPDYSDDSREIKMPFKYLPEMNPEGSVRDMLTISINPETITFHGTPIKDVNGKYTHKFNRKTCKEKIKTIPKPKKGIVKNEVIGKWLDKSYSFGGTITIYGEDGKLFMAKKYNEDGSIGTDVIVEIDSKKGRVFQHIKGGGDAGEYYLIDKQGNLQLWDEEGIIWTAKKIN